MSKRFRWISLLLLAGLSAWIVTYAARSQETPTPTYAGAIRCKKCHLERYNSWKADRHSKAFEYIEVVQQKNPECLKCHTTGYGEGGFVSMEKTSHLTGVQCEQCHGMGKEHVPLMSRLKKEKVNEADYPEDKKIDKKPRTCIKCHSPHQEHIPID
ncbi:MAG: multiheme c-type cytochrome [Planctomycetota bacterium]|jgi:hypothetical protein